MLAPGNARVVYYIPRSASTITNPTRGSNDPGTGCNNTAFTMNGNYYQAIPNDVNTTGIGVANNPRYDITVDYVP